MDTRAADLHSDDVGSIGILSELSLQDPVQYAFAWPDGSAITAAAHFVEGIRIPPPVADDDACTTPKPASQCEHRDVDAMRDRCSDAVYLRRLERTRARNRAAQARHRQKQKERPLHKH